MPGRRSGSRWARARSGWRCSSPSPSPSHPVLFGDAGAADLVRAADLAWRPSTTSSSAALFRVEERLLAFVSASLANVLITIGLTLLLVVALEKGALGVIAGNFSGTLIVYLALLGYRREQLGLQFDRGLLREMNRFGLLLVPTALFLWVTNFSDRFFLVKLSPTSPRRACIRSASGSRRRWCPAHRAFRLAWPAFAYSIADDDEARRTYAYVLTYLTVVTGWVALALTLPSPWIVDVLATPEFAELVRRRPARVLDGRLRRVHRRRDRRRARTPDPVQLGRHRAAAAINVALNLALIPEYGMMGAAIATVAAYATMAVGMGVVVAAHLPCAVPVAAGRDGRRRAAHRCARSGARRRPRRGRRADPRLPFLLLLVGFTSAEERRCSTRLGTR